MHRNLSIRVVAMLSLVGVFYIQEAYGDDTMHLTDQPGNWFRSEATGTPFTVIDPGDEIDFRINNCCTSTRHTVTLLVKPEASNVALDQGSSQMGTLSLEFDVPGVYVFDGRNDDGKRVPPGIYLARLRAADETAHLKISVLR